MGWWSDFRDAAIDVIVAPVQFLIIDPIEQVVDWLTPDPPDVPRPEPGVLLNLDGADRKIPIVYGDRLVGGTRVFKGVSGTSNEFLHVVLVLCEGGIDSIGTVYIDDVVSTDPKYAGLVTITRYTGTATQAADPDLVASFANWTANHRLLGTAYIHVKLTWNKDVFRGFPKITARVRGRKVLDPRTGQTVWSQNPALCLRDYLTDDVAGAGLDPSTVPDAFISAAATTCEEQIPTYLGSGATMDRFAVNGAIDTERKVIDNVRALLGACRGLLPFTAGEYRLRIEQGEAPVFTFTEDTILGGWNIQGTNKRGKLNRVKVRFINPNRNWQPDEAIQESATWYAEDGGLRLEKDMDFSLETDPYRAAYHAEVILKKSREGVRCAFLASIDALQVAVGDVVAVTHPGPGWTDKRFRVQHLELQATGNVAVQLREHDPTAYDRTVPVGLPAAPDTNLPDPFTVAAPTGITVASGTAHLLTLGDGTIVSRAFVSWTPSADAFVDHYEVQGSREVAGNWSDVPPVRTAETAAYMNGVQDGINYLFRVRAVNTAGVASAWTVTSPAHLVLGKQEVPAIPNLVAYTTTAAGRRRLTWRMPAVTPDLAGFEIRYYPALTGGGWNNASKLVDGLVVVDPNVVPPNGDFSYEWDHLPAGDYQFYVRPWDTSGLTSINAASSGGVTLPAPPLTSADWSQVTGTGKPEDFAASRDANLVPDPNFQGKAAGTSGYWADGTDVAYSPTAGENGTPGLVISPSSGASVSAGTNLDFPLEPGETLFVRFRYLASAGFDPFGSIRLEADLWNYDRSVSYGTLGLALESPPVIGAWTEVVNTITIPTVVPIALMRLVFTVTDALAAGSVTITNVYVSRTDKGADVTGDNTALAIAGQGALATANAADWPTQVTGVGKPADGADVTQDVIDTGILTTGAVWMNSGTFGQAGVQIEHNGGTPRLHVGDGTSGLKWDGLKLTVATETGTGNARLEVVDGELRLYDGAELIGTIGITQPGFDPFILDLGSLTSNRVALQARSGSYTAAVLHSENRTALLLSMGAGGEAPLQIQGTGSKPGHWAGLGSLLVGADGIGRGDLYFVENSFIQPGTAKWTRLNLVKATVCFDGTGAVGTAQTIRFAENVASVTKTANGTYTVAFADWINGSFSVMATAGRPAGGGVICTEITGSRWNRDVKVETRLHNGVIANDCDYVSVTVLGNF